MMEPRNRTRLAWMWTSLAVACGVVVSSCSTEVDLTAPYDSLPVVYGLLEVEADTQWVKINRTWLGEGSQLIAAQVADSSEYPAGAIDARIVELIPSSTGGVVGNELPTGREWTLRDTLVDNKETSGAFFGPLQRVYFASTLTEPLRDDMLYQLVLELPDGKTAQATTTMVESSAGSINQPPPNLPNYKMGFAAVNPNGSATYPNFPFKWTTSPGASLYTASLVVHVEERYYADDALTLLDSSRDRTVTIPVGTRKVSNLDGFQTIDEPFDGERLFTELSTRLEANPRIRRVLGRYDANYQLERAFDFELQVANQDLAIFLDVNETSGSIVQDRPTWTNIEVIAADGTQLGGIGLWGSRTTLGVYGLGYSKQTIQHLQEGDLTAALNFCSPSPLSDYSCD
ncbi:MAG: hypothetical protein O2990_04485 [Bacteroidetes bacterium]|nr:hypothetical protein [Bacteroidota bacterium]